MQRYVAFYSPIRAFMNLVESKCRVDVSVYIFAKKHLQHQILSDSTGRELSVPNNHAILNEVHLYCSRLCESDLSG